MRFTEENLIIPLTSGFTTVTADGELQSFNMRGYDHCCMVFALNNAYEAVTDNAALTFETGSASSGDSADLTFHYRYSSATTTGASSDVLGAWSSASTVSFASAYAGALLFVEFDAEDLPAASKTYEWVTPDINAGTTSVGAVYAYAILSRPRYAKNVMPTAV